MVSYYRDFEELLITKFSFNFEEYFVRKENIEPPTIRRHSLLTNLASYRGFV